MLKGIAELFISAVELLEAEGRQVREWSKRLGAAFTLFLVAGLLGAVGVLMLAAACFIWLEGEIGRAPALVIVGVVILAIAGGLAWRAEKTIR